MEVAPSRQNSQLVLGAIVAGVVVTRAVLVPLLELPRRVDYRRHIRAGASHAHGGAAAAVPGPLDQRLAVTVQVRGGEDHPAVPDARAIGRGEGEGVGRRAQDLRAVLVAEPLVDTVWIGIERKDELMEKILHRKE